MVKHQRRSHQRGIHSSELDDGETSDSDSGESPSTPEHSGQVQWAQGIQVHSGMPHPSGQTMHRAHSFNDFSQQHLNGYGQQTYVHRHSLSGSAHDYNATGSNQGHSNGILQRDQMAQAQSYYILEQGNPGMATMNANHRLIQGYHIHQEQRQNSGVATLNGNQGPIQTYHIPQHQESRQSVSCASRSLPSSVQSSPGGYSSGSVRSPIGQEVYCTHQPVQTTHYTHQNRSQVEHQPMVQYHQQVPPMTQAAPQPTAPLIPQGVEQYQQSPQEEHWYASGTFQEPVQVASVHSYNTNHNGIYDPWVGKLESFDDIQAQQLPSARVETL
jgi:metal regulatory transcription factor 1